MAGRTLREQLLAAPVGEIRRTLVPEFANPDNPEGVFYLLELDGGRFAAWQLTLIREVPITRKDGTQTTEEQNELSNGEVKLLLHTLCEPDGTLCFTPAEGALLQQLPYRVLARLSSETIGLNGLKAADFEALEKNLEGGPSNDSGSASPDI